MILDDYSMGLDAGYRRLFLDYLNEYARSEEKTIFITSHIIQDLDGLIDDIVILDYRSVLLRSTVRKLRDEFKQYCFDVEGPDRISLEKNELIRNFEIIKNHVAIYTFAGAAEIQSYLKNKGVQVQTFKEKSMSLEDAFIGLTGKY